MELKFDKKTLRRIIFAVLGVMGVDVLYRFFYTVNYLDRHYIIVILGIKILVGGKLCPLDILCRLGTATKLNSRLAKS